MTEFAAHCWNCGAEFLSERLQLKRRSNGWKTSAALSLATLEQLGVASGTTFFPGLKKKQAAIFFGYADGWKVRSFPEKDFVSVKGFVRSFWNLDAVLFSESETVYLVEGEFRCLRDGRGWRSEATSVLACHGAKEKKSETEKDFSGYAYVEAALAAGLNKVKKFVWCGDSDGAGRVLRDDMVSMLGAAKFWFVAWPEGIKDANEMLLKYGGDALRELVLYGALQWTVDGVYRPGRNLSQRQWSCGTAVSPNGRARSCWRRGP